MKKICPSKFYMGISVVLLSLCVAGCGPSKKDSAPEDKPSESTALTPTGEPLVIEDPSTVAASDQPMTEADKAWQEFQQATQTEDPPASWREKEPSEEELAKFKIKIAGQLVGAADQALAFYTNYPEHENAPEARWQEIGLLTFGMRLGDTNVGERVELLEASMLKNPELSEDEKVQLRIQQMQRRLATDRNSESQTALENLEKGARAIQKDFPNRPEVGAVLMFAAERWLDEGKADKAKAIAEEVAKIEGSEDVQKEAKSLVAKIDRLGQPLEIKFTAIDGREVNLQAMKGKVVLVDFWATWCQPCLAELPKIKATYEKLNAKGFEIIGISFDREQPTLERFVKKEEMPWPQHFDMKEGSESLGDKFEVMTIPTMWLVDKQGRLVDLNAGNDLEAKIEKYLAE